jgi:hypothetical protein
MEPESSLPLTQVPAISPYPEPYRNYHIPREVSKIYHAFIVFQSSLHVYYVLIFLCTFIAIITIQAFCPFSEGWVETKFKVCFSVTLFLTLVPMFYMKQDMPLLLKLKSFI